MLGNAGHTIQKLINSTPIAISVNETTSTVVTNGGSVHQAGLVGHKIQSAFAEVLGNNDIVGKVVDAKSTESSVYLLNAAGSVFRYDYSKGSQCNPQVREVYSPCVCNGDPAVKIAAGKNHAVILTASKKVYGVGSNDEYQLVPQGQCEYDVATEILVTDTVTHDNSCPCSFTGSFNELTTPVLPAQGSCGSVSCVSNAVTGVKIGYVPIPTQSGSGQLEVPIYGDYSYSGVLCASDNTASGTVTVVLTAAYIPSGSVQSNFGTLLVADRLELLTAPFTSSSQVSGQCGSTFCVVVTAPLLNVDVAADGHYNIVVSANNITSVVALQDGEIRLVFNPSIALVPVLVPIHVVLACCPPKKDCCSDKCPLPQPCWSDVFAGFDITVLVDTCNRLYVLGSLHEVRNNHDLLKRSCLDKLLQGTSATITLPADQLNCGLSANNECKCSDAKRSCKTDLSRMGVQINFPGDEEPRDCGSCSKSSSLCDFLQSLQQCNSAPACDNTCEPCDPYVYLDVYATGLPACTSSGRNISKIVLHNRKSVAKTVSTGSADSVCVRVTKDSIVEFDLNKYCIDGVDYCLDKTIKLEFGCGGDWVNLYLDLDTPGGLKFAPKCDNPKANVEFQVNTSTDTHKFLLNFGGVLDPVEVANLRGALSLPSVFPSPCYLNPFNNKITNTYLRGGDRVQFISPCHGLRHAVTADVPTVFRLGRRVLDVGVGDNNLSVLVGGLACPNEIHAIGKNCHGELGLGSHESHVTWKQVNRCYFDCQVNSIVSGDDVTFYITQSGHVYASGSWKCTVNSTVPARVSSDCQSWKAKKLAVSKSHILLLSTDGCLFGIGDNSLGQLGLCHTYAVKSLTPLTISKRLDRLASKEIYGGHRHHKKSHDCECEDRSDCQCEVRYVRHKQQLKTQAYIPNGRVAPSRRV